MTVKRKPDIREHPISISASDALNIIADAAEKAANKIDAATERAASLLAGAADKATTALASAAKDANILLASNASEAAKITSKPAGEDHDLLIRLETKLENLRTDIKDLKDGTNDKIADHERRLGALESSKTKQNTLMSIGIGILTLLVGLLLFHLFKV